MAQDFEDRVTAVNLGRRCSRLVDASSAAGEETEASASAGASVEIFDIGGVPYRLCGNDVHGHAGACEACDPDPLIPTGWGDLVDEHGERYCKAPELTRFVVYYPERLQGEKPAVGTRGPRPKGVRNRDVIVDAIVARQREIRFDSWAEWLVWRDRVYAQAPKTPREWQRHLVSVVGRVPEANTKVLSGMLGRSEATIRRWRKMSANSAKGEMQPVSTLEFDIRLSRIEARLADVKDAVEATLEHVREQFPGDDRVRAAVDEFLADTLDAD
jgi:hypothetical protein